MNKGRLTILSVIITMLVFGGIMLGFLNFYGSMSQKYDVKESSREIQGNVSEQANYVTEQAQDLANSTKTRVSGFRTGFAPVDLTIVAVQGAFNVVLSFLEIPEIMFAMINAGATALGLPGWTVGIIDAIITITIAYLVLKIILGRL